MMKSVRLVADVQIVKQTGQDQLAENEDADNNRHIEKCQRERFPAHQQRQQAIRALDPARLPDCWTETSSGVSRSWRRDRRSWPAPPRGRPSRGSGQAGRDDGRGDNRSHDAANGLRRPQQWLPVNKTRARIERKRKTGSQELFGDDGRSVRERQEQNRLQKWPSLHSKTCIQLYFMSGFPAALDDCCFCNERCAASDLVRHDAAPSACVVAGEGLEPPTPGL